MRRSRRRAPLDRLVGLLFLATLLQYGVTCRVTTSHDDEEEPYDVERTTGEEAVLPSDGIFLDERITIELGGPVDPDSVDPGTVRIHRADTGETADGTFEVEGPRIVFVPRPPSRADLADAGLAPGARYRIHLPGRREGSSVRGTDGSVLADGYSVRFETRGSAPFFRDAVPGPPRPEAVFVDADGDGAVDGWAEIASNTDSELDPPRSILVDAVVPARQGDERATDRTCRVALLFSEPLDPRSVEEPDSLSFRIVPRGRAARAVAAARAPSSAEPHVRLASEYDPESRHFRSVVTFEVPATLSGESLLRLDASRRLRDLAGEPLEERLFVTIRTRTE